ncbi:MAG: tetratricopeptide repeat protein [Rubrivivax sp.]
MNKVYRSRGGAGPDTANAAGAASPRAVATRWRRGLAGLALALPLLGCAQLTQTAPATKPPLPAQPMAMSPLDGPLFYQLLVAEIELRNGRAGIAFEVVLEAARRTREAQLFQRAVDIALRARAGDRALEAARAWRTSLPQAVEPLRLQLQILAALNRPGDAAEPLRALLGRTEPAQQPALIGSMPRLFQRASEQRVVATMLEAVLLSEVRRGPARASALAASGRAWLQADDLMQSLRLVRQALAAGPAVPEAVLLAIDLMPRVPAAEALVRDALASDAADPALRVAYARGLVRMQRPQLALEQLEIVNRQQPALSAAWLLRGALHLELREPARAEEAIQRYLQVAGLPDGSAGSAASASGASDEDAVPIGDDEEAPGQAALSQAWLMLAQAAEQRGDLAAAEAYLSRVGDPQRVLEVQSRRAALLARQGQLEQARALLRSLPERDEEQARDKLVAEAHLLRDLERWAEAYEVFDQAATRWPDDAGLLYEQSMVAEKLDRIDEMERLLRRVIQLDPKYAHAYNALGYSLADRGLRLDEAKALIVKALELMPGDPFITDSLGWVEFRLGNLQEARRLLQQAWDGRPDAEIGAHLGEVLWVMGRRDEALGIWRQAIDRDGANKVLRQTLARLGVQP